MSHPTRCTRSTSPKSSARSRSSSSSPLPALCQSRVCGPVVDVVQQVADSYEPEVDFIHQEVYVENEISKGIRPQLQAFGLPTEPWTFLIGKDGVIKDRLEGAYGASELEASDEVDRAWLNSRSPTILKERYEATDHPSLLWSPASAWRWRPSRPRPTSREGAQKSDLKKSAVMTFETCRHGCHYRTIQRAVDAAGAYKFKNPEGQDGGRGASGQVRRGGRRRRHRAQA